VSSLRVPGLLIAGVLAVAACGGSASPAASGGASTSAGPSGGAAACDAAPEGTTPAATVIIRDFQYDPATVTIKAGEAVAWVNEDTASHTVTTTDGSCDSGTIRKGATATLVFAQAGTYTYHCSIHASMPDATIEVSP